MRHWIVTIVAVVCTAFAFSYAQQGPPADGGAAAQPPQEPVEMPQGLESLDQRMSYMIGYGMMNKLKQDLAQQPDMFELDRQTLIRGIEDALEGKDAELSEAVRQATDQELRQKMMDQMQNQAKANKAAGETFLAENAEKQGVKTTESGLQYKVIEEGEGESPKATDTVTVDYEGKLLDGTVFDSSYQHGEPATFALNRVIPGWTEGVQLMKPGAKYMLYVPGDLAYGQSPRSPGGPNSLLIFTVELHEVKAAADEPNRGD